MSTLVFIVFLEKEMLKHYRPCGKLPPRQVGTHHENSNPSPAISIFFVLPPNHCHHHRPNSSSIMIVALGFNSDTAGRGRGRFVGA